MATTKTKRKQIEQNEARTVLETVKGIDLQTVLKDVTTLQLTVQKTLSELSATVTNKVQQVEHLDTAIELKDSRLQELHNIEREAVSLDDLRAQREDERLKWERERAEVYAKWGEEDADRAKKLKREQDEYAYNVQQEQKKAKDEFAAQVAQSKRDESVRAETFKREWEAKDAAIKAREQEFSSLQAQVAGFDQRLKAEVQKAEAVVGSVVKAKYEHEAALLKKDADAAKSLADMRIAALNEQIGGLQSQIEDLHTQLISARQDAKEVANEALKSAASRQLAETLQRVVTEGQGSPGKTK